MGRDKPTKEPPTGDRLFQSTRPHGARPGRRRSGGKGRSFNPRARMGRDTSRSGFSGGMPCFNPRARMGRDKRPFLDRVKANCFNPRARMGRDSVQSGRRRQLQRFNPRARMGRDQEGIELAGLVLAVSIHAPAWGATFGRCRRYRAGRFQSTRPHGARLSWRGKWLR